MKEWWERLDFEINPLVNDPEEFSPFGLDDKLDELLYRIESGSIVFVEGVAGSGKTGLLFMIIDKLKGKGRVIYFDCKNLEREISIEKFMKERYGFFGKLLGKTPKDMILLLDNVSFLSAKNSERIKYYFDNGILRSAVFTGENYSKANLPRGVRERIGSRIIKLKSLSDEDVVEMIKRRLDGKIFSTEIIKKIYKLSDRNMISFLENCNSLCEKYCKKEGDVVEEIHLKEFFGGKYGIMV